MKLSCHFCHSVHNISPLVGVGRRDACDSCGRDLRVCLNCEFYDANANRQCREPAISEAVRDKDRANFCDYFRVSVKISGESSGGQKKSEQDLAREALASLFKKT
jgi:hypothetical protein